MCGKEFENDYQNAKFCNRQCYENFRKENRKLRTRQCLICNKNFQPSYSGQVFCSVSCRAKSTENKVQCIYEYCGKVFYRQKAEVEKNKRNYCSKDCKIKAISWSLEDVEILKENYGKIKYKDMVSLFSQRRSTKETRRKAISLGLTSSREWTSEEIAILIENYSKEPMDELIKLLPNRTISSILGQARRQDLKSFFYLKHTYSQDEDIFLKENYLTKSNEELGKHLGRSPNGIAQHLYSLNLRRPMEINNYENIYNYIRQRIVPWRNKVRESNNYTCELTGVRSNIVVHHIRGFNLLLEEAICDLNFPIYSNIASYTQEQLDNLLDTFLLIQDTYHSYICISEKIHKHFHSVYGYGNNTEDQWNEFVNTYYK